MPEYNSNLRALNDIVADYGLPAGHHFEIDALNALAVHLGGSGGHHFNIDALNEIVGLVEGSGTFRFEIDAYNEISRALGGRSDFEFVEDALSEISDLPVFSGGGGGEPEWLEVFRAPSGDLPLVAAQFKDGNYWANAAEAALGDIFEDGPSDSTWDPANVVGGTGLTGVVTSSGPDLKDTVTAGLLGGFTFVGKAGTFIGGNAVLVEIFDNPDYNFEFMGNAAPSEATLEDQYDLFLVAGGVATGQKFAFTITPTELAVSANGSAALTGVPETPSGLNKIRVFVSNGNVLEWGMFYPPQPSADLADLTAA